MPLTEKETRARAMKKYSTTTFGFNTRKAYEGSMGDVSNSSSGNFYSPQLSTDFLEKPQNLRERRAWYRLFYNSNEFVGQAIDLHSTLPMSKIRLEKPKCKNTDLSDYVYDYFVDLCDDVKLFKTLIEVSHEYWLLGNCGRYDTDIRTDQGYKKLGEINPGDRVLTHKNRFRKVEAKVSRLADEGFSIKPWYSSKALEVTGEHPLEVYRDGSFKFVKSEEVSIKDYLRFSYPDEVKDVETINFCKDFKNIKMVDGGYEKKVNIITEFFSSPNEIKIDGDFLYLLGYWLGNGTLARDNSRKDRWGRGLWHITFGTGSEKNEEKVKAIIERKLGKYNVRYHQGKDTVNLSVSNNPAFLEWWALNFGETSHGTNKKRVPKWIHDLPQEKLEHLLSGVLDSYGCIVKDKTTYTVCVSLSSDTLIRSIRDISLKCGSFVSYTCEKNIRKMPKSLKRAVSKTCKKVSILRTVSGSDIWVKHSIKQPKEDLVCTKPNYLIEVDGSYAVKVKGIEMWEKDTVYNLQVEEDSTYQMDFISTHNCFIFAEDHEPYTVKEEDEETAKAKIAELKEAGRIKSDKLYKEFDIVDKDPNYLGWRKLLILPPDQVRIKKIPLSDESLIEFIPDPETKKNILQSRQGLYPGDFFQAEKNPYHVPDIPEKLASQLEENGTIPLDTDPYSGSYVYHLARKKSQYETLGVSILERCINTLLLQDKLRQTQTSIASRHMTPIRIVWGEDMSEMDVENLREQVDIALVDPDFSIIANYQVNWEEMGSNGRLLELSGEYEHIENSLFAGLGVTREILTGEGTYSGNRITLEIMNTQYLLFRELIQDYVENYLFKPAAKKKGFVETDKYGREKLIYPKLSFTRLAIRDNDAFFDQVFQLYNKGSVSIDVILDMLNIDAEATSKKIKSDLFTVDDPAYNQLMANIYTAAGQGLVERYDVLDKLADYMGFSEVEQPQGEEGAGGDLGGGMPRFAGAKKKENPKVAAMPSNKKMALQKMLNLAMQKPEKLEQIVKFLERDS